MCYTHYTTRIELSFSPICFPAFINCLVIRVTISSIAIGLKLPVLPSCYRTVCYWTVCYRTVQKANHIQSCSLKQPITYKVVVTCASACARLLLCFWRLIADSRRGGLLSMYFNANRPILSKLGNFFSRKLKLLWSIGDKTSCRPIRPVIVSITKFSIVIGSPRAYLSCNRRAITWVSNYKCLIWTFFNWIPTWFSRQLRAP